MPKKKSRPIRVETERSQPGVKMAKHADCHEQLRRARNRIEQLEKALGHVSRGGNTTNAVVVFVAPNVLAELDAMTNSGYYGETVALTAYELLRMKMREETVEDLRARRRVVQFTEELS